MDLIPFQGMMFLKPSVELASSFNWYPVVLSLMMLVGVLQAVISVFSVVADGDLRFMRGAEYRQHSLFFISQILSVFFVGILTFSSFNHISFSYFTYYGFATLLAYFGVCSLALHYNVSKALVYSTVGIGLFVCAAASFQEYQVVVYSLGLMIAAGGHSVSSLSRKLKPHSYFVSCYQVLAVVMSGCILFQSSGALEKTPLFFSILLLVLSCNQCLLSVSRVLGNYVRSVDDRDQEHLDYAEAEKRKINSIYENLHDEVTCCPNDGYLVNYLNNSLKVGDLEEFALFCIQVRGLRPVQNALGIETANGLLKACAQRLAVIGHALEDFLVISNNAEDLGCVVRSEGREFFMISRNTSSEVVDRYCDKINETFTVPFEFGGLCLDLQGNIGVATFPLHGQTPQQVMQYANVAVDIAKRTSYGSVLFDPLLDPSVQRRLILLGDLRGAMNRGDIFMTYQPQLCLATNQVLGVEGLIRWRHPVLGNVPPDEFITLAEQTGMIKHISRWVCDHAAMDFVRLNLEGFSLKISINISPNNLLEDNFSSVLLAILEEYKIPAGGFCVELTETAVMLDPERVKVSIDHMTHHGVIFSIDDFGTGFSSLANLKRLKVKQLKIDKDFIGNLEDNAEDGAIVRATIEMANCLGVQTVAEGVESLAVIEMLKILGCDIIQGFYVSKGLELEELIHWLVSRPQQTNKIQHLAVGQSTIDG